jgi:type I restriction enzyme, S subunit
VTRRFKRARIAWASEIPESWQEARVVSVARLESGHTPSRQHDEYWVPTECTIPWFGLADVWQLRDGSAQYVFDTAEKISPLGVANSAARVLPKDTVILSRTASVGFSGILGIPMATTQDFANFVCGSRILPRYLLHVLRAMKPDFDRLMMGSTHRTIYMPDIRKLSTPVPPLDEQRAIADFLDEKTAAIDGLIAKKERLLALLDEQRQALITRAVTQGLDPSVPMKDSGMEGVGLVPISWQVVRLKHLAQVRTGLPKGRVLDGVTVSVPYLRVANVQAGYLKLDDVTEMEVLPAEVSRFSLRYGDVLMNEGGDNDKLGRGTVWREQIVPCLHQNHVFAVRPRRTELSTWIAMSTLGGVLRTFFRGRAKQSTNLASISSSNLKEAPIVLPPDQDRMKIEANLERALNADAHRQNLLKASMDALREYRQALITAAVTGQLDVRSKQARAMEPAA